MERLPKFQTGGFISDKTIFTDVNVGHGVEFIQKPNSVPKKDKIVEAIETSINNLFCIKECKVMEKQTANILGTEYTIEELSKKQDKSLNECDGYCDKTTHRIVVCTKEDDCDLGDFSTHRNKVLRHEIIHAFHFESGIAENLENKQYGFSETIVDWFAIQSPKIFKVFQELDIL